MSTCSPVLFSSPSTNSVLSWASSFLPFFSPPFAFLLPASDIQTLPRVYFFDSFATLQANGTESRFFSSSVCHSHIPHSHLCLHYSFVFCLPAVCLSCAILVCICAVFLYCRCAACSVVFSFLFHQVFAFSDSAVLV